MSSGFYAECLEEIAQLIRQGRIQEARTKVDTELAMPYVPSDVLPALQDFDRQLRLIAAENRKPGVGVMSLEEIEESLKGDREQQLPGGRRAAWDESALLPGFGPRVSGNRS